MPIPSAPPYLSTATTWPRQLNRWLDINAQNGSLSRTQTYITLPAFTVNINWQGYSDIVGTYNFTGPNNFSLIGIKGALPSNPNYLLCIMWIDYKNQVHRYALWQNVGEVMYVPYPLYAGQPIGQNFRLEIWSTNVAQVSQISALNLYTSVAGIQDYRHGSDIALCTTNGLNTNFGINATNVLTLPTDIGLLFQVDPFSGITTAGNILTGWTCKAGTVTLIPFGSGITVNVAGVPCGCNCINVTANQYYLYNSAPTPIWGVTGLMLTCMIYGTEANNTYLFSAYPSGLAMFWNNGTVSSGGAGPAVTGLSQNVWYTFFFYLNGGNATLAVYNTQTGALVTSQTTLAPIVYQTTAIGLGNTPCKILEAIMFSNIPSNTDITAMAAYQNQKYFSGNTFSLPLIFPAGSVPAINTNTLL